MAPFFVSQPSDTLPVEMETYPFEPEEQGTEAFGIIYRGGEVA